MKRFYSLLGCLLLAAGPGWLLFGDDQPQGVDQPQAQADGRGQSQQRLLPLDSPLYQEIRDQAVLAGRAPPSTAYPYSRAEMDQAWRRLGKESPEVSERGLSWEDEEAPAALQIVPEISLAAGYTSLDASARQDLQPLQRDRPYLRIPLEFQAGAFLAGALDLEVVEEPLAYTLGRWPAVNLPSQPNYLDSSVPHRAFLNLGGGFWALQMGRDQVSWGNGKTGNLILSDAPPFHDLLRGTLFGRRWKFSYIYSVQNGHLSPEEREQWADETRAGWYFNFNEEYMAFAAHRIEGRFWKNRVQVALTEGIQFGNKYPQLSDFNPLMLFHSWNIPERANSIISVEVDAALLPGWTVYGQAAQDEMRSTFEEGAFTRPTARGWLAGTAWLHRLAGGVLELSAEGVWTDPWLYNRWHPLTKISSRHRYWSYFTNAWVYIEEPLGYKGGPDVLLGTAALEWRCQNYRAGLTYTGERVSEMDLDTEYKGEWWDNPPRGAFQYRHRWTVQGMARIIPQLRMEGQASLLAGWKQGSSAVIPPPADVSLSAAVTWTF